MIMSELISIFIKRLNGTYVLIDPGEMIFEAGEEVEHIYLMLAGQVCLVRYLQDGAELTLNRVSGKAVLAEASVFSPFYHCSAKVIEAAELYRVTSANFRDLLLSDASLALEWSWSLAASLQNARMRSEILTMKRVSTRLTAWMDWNGGELPEKGRWKQLASEIGVTPEALYREIARRKQA